MKHIFLTYNYVHPRPHIIGYATHVWCPATRVEYGECR